jgi:hypothetical protein
MDQREYIHDPEETLRTVFAGLMRNVWTAMPSVMTEDTKDGHRCVPQPSIKRSVTDPVTGLVSYVEHQIHPDVPIHYAGGGGVTATHPIKKGDEGTTLYASRAIDAPMQQGGTAQPIDDRQHHLGDGIFMPGIRSDPRKLQQVSNDAHHVRSDDKKHVTEVHPENGITHHSSDPSTAPASASFDPLSMATKFYRHVVQGAKGLIGQATDGGTTHDHGVTHDDGAFMRVVNGLHSVLAHPANGASMNAANALHQVLAHPSDGASMLAQSGLHKVLAHPSIGAALMGQNGASSIIAKATLALQSATGISLSCPAGGLSLPAGGVSSGSLASGAAASNVGTLGGDLAGTLPSPQVVGLGHVDAHLLPVAANDAAAAALNPPVPIGGLYLNTNFVQAGTVSGSTASGSGGSTSGTSSTTLPASGIAVLCVRMV